MFEEINNLKILNRRLTEDTDYLNQEEYNSVIENLKIDENIDLFIEILKRYDKAGQCDFKIEGQENTFCFPSEIKVNKDDSYYSSSNRDIAFKDDYYTIKNGNYYLDARDTHKEGKFKIEYLSYVIKVLDNLYSEYDFIKKDSYYSSYYYTYDIKPLEFLKTYNKLKARKELLERIKGYYSCRIVDVKIDEEFNKELQELEDFINSI